MKKYLAAIVLALAFAAPFAASAALTQAQINAVVGLLRSFGANDTVISNVSSALAGLPVTPTPAPGSSCTTPWPLMAYGSTDAKTGGAVSRLQVELAKRGYLTGSATGFYGTLTRAAVGNYQISTGIVASASTAGYGLFGPRTAVTFGCGGPIPPPAAGGGGVGPGLPTGSLDIVTCTSATGWAQDGDTPTTPVQVVFYVDSPSGTGYAGEVTANVHTGRADITSYPGAENLGFTFTMPEVYKDGKSHTLYAYGVDSGGSGGTGLLMNAPKTFSCSGAAPTSNTLPKGGLDVVTCDAAQGWAQDPDTPAAPIQVHFYIDNPGAGGYVGSVTADLNKGRADLAAIGASNQSYSFSIPAVFKDGRSHTLYAYGIDSSGNGGTGTLVGSPQTFSCSAGSPLPVSQRGPYISVTSIGNYETVFDYETEACAANDTPDNAQHAYRMANGNVALTGFGPFGNYRSVGQTLDTVKRNCTPTYPSANDPAFGNFKYHEWLTSPYTLDGTNVYALTHNEWYPSLGGFCSANTGPLPVAGAITLLTSRDGGATYTHPADYKLAVPTVLWDSTISCNTGYGDWNQTNILSRGGYYYALFTRFGDPAGVANTGTCAMRTNNLAAASSWQVWSGSGWVAMSSTPKCGVLPGLEGWVTLVPDSLVWSTYLNRYVALAIDNATSVQYSTSLDLIHWTAPQTLLTLPVPQGRLMYGSLLDPTDTSRNFENIGQTPYLYFALENDVIRQKIQFTKQY